MQKANFSWFAIWFIVMIVGWPAYLIFFRNLPTQVLMIGASLAWAKIGVQALIKGWNNN